MMDPTIISETASNKSTDLRADNFLPFICPFLVISTAIIRVISNLNSKGRRISHVSNRSIIYVIKHQWDECNYVYNIVVVCTRQTAHSRANTGVV